MFSHQCNSSNVNWDFACSVSDFGKFPLLLLWSQMLQLKLLRQKFVLDDFFVKLSFGYINSQFFAFFPSSRQVFMFGRMHFGKLQDAYLFQEGIEISCISTLTEFGFLYFLALLITSGTVSILPQVALKQIYGTTTGFDIGF